MAIRIGPGTLRCHGRRLSMTWEARAADHTRASRTPRPSSSMAVFTPQRGWHTEVGVKDFPAQMLQATMAAVARQNMPETVHGPRLDHQGELRADVALAAGMLPPAHRILGAGKRYAERAETPLYGSRPGTASSVASTAWSVDSLGSVAAKRTAAASAQQQAQRQSLGARGSLPSPLAISTALRDQEQSGGSSHEEAELSSTSSENTESLKVDMAPPWGEELELAQLRLANRALGHENAALRSKLGQALDLATAHLSGQEHDALEASGAGPTAEAF